MKTSRLSPRQAWLLLAFLLVLLTIAMFSIRAKAQTQQTWKTVESGWPGRLTTVPQILDKGILCWKTEQPFVFGNCVVLVRNWQTLGLTKKWRWNTQSEFDYALKNHLIVTVPKPAGF